MSPEDSFIKEIHKKPEAPEKKKTPADYLEQEIRDQISVFPSEVQIIIRKKQDNVRLTAEEFSIFDTALHKWWEEVYGFKYFNKTAREEVLIRKYGTKKEIIERLDLQKEFLLAIKEKDELKLSILKWKYIESYPNQLEGVEIIFGLSDYLKKSIFLDQHRDQVLQEDKKAYYTDLTEWQFLITHFVLTYGNDKEFMKLFWEVAETIAKESNALRKFNTLKRGQICQVAVHKIMQELGKNPKLSHPDEDALNSIDLWTEEGAVQIKGWREEVPALLRTDVITFPAIETDVSQTKKSLFSSTEYMKSQNKIFLYNVSNYARHLGKEVEGYMLVAPYSKMDFITGDPDPSLVDFFRKELQA